MKILGHAYIATRAIKGNNRLLIIGSVLPEMLPYIPNDIFVYQELHEGGRKLLEYLNIYHPEKRDLALGLLSHGVEFGADQFGQKSEALIGLERENLLSKIVQAHNINLKAAKGRLHNYVGLAIDWLLIKNEPALVEEVQQVLRTINLEEISSLLAEGFQKDAAKVRSMLETLFKKIYQPEDLLSAEGLAKIWARQAAGLPEKDRVDVTKSADIIRACASLLEKTWRNFLELTTNKVSENLQPFTNKEGNRKVNKEQEN